MMTCTCGHFMGDKAERCPGCHEPNHYDTGNRVRRSISDVLWALMGLACVLFLVLYMVMLGKAENAIQQVFAAADALMWTVASYVVVRSLTSVLRRR
jgi:hypothetical protein